MRDIAAQQKRHQTQEHEFWSRQIRAAHWLNWITAIGATVGLIGLAFIGLSLRVAERTADDARQALVVANRAWLSPESAQISSPINTKDMLSFTVYYYNTGKEPALGFAAQEDHAWSVPAPKPNASWFTVFNKSSINDICAGTSSDTEITKYPTGQLQQYHITMDHPLTDDIISGRRVLLLHGCFAYHSPVSGNVTYKSEYCFLFPLLPGSVGPVFTAISCMYGNNAT
jgi:hypothetical protein